MDKFDQQQIIIKRVKKGGHGHHGGAWKVALADFAMAMMALFLILWLINSSNQEEIEAVAGYFNDPAAYEDGNKVPSKWVIDLGGSPSVQDNVAVSETVDPTKVLQAEEIESAAEAIERARLESLQSEVMDKINASATLTPYKDQLKVDITREGLRIQIVDKTNRPMFNPGSSRLKYYAEDILYEMAPILQAVPNRISITGHTDSSGSANPWDTGNWELSAGRANAARRALADAGLDSEKIAQVVGMGDKAHFNIEDPTDPVNRRIAIVVLNKRTEQAIQSRAGGYIQEAGAAVKEEERDEAIGRTGTILEELQQRRESENNPYDSPPPDVDEEAFW
ncbi:flagellar motor protein MotB [Bermanella marisrubri]|uniref:Motility protein, MotA family protein n=1 Tax=Bermanella marisrubri TaxID=207949 RepID=Q1N254_9GAMM|nr:flagellar motor protein MotB [Bermanella marisrubri]EAT12310.1 motility protein, MotA family protein [Bermanella marisrubri]QIZ85398.1 flagellar motor protein MotB [Bermanella marisrubri]